MKTPKQLREQAKENKIFNWFFRDCSICNAPVGYLFNINGKVYFDGPCECSNHPSVPFECSWRNVAEQFNCQKNETIIEKYNQFWGFENENTNL